MPLEEEPRDFSLVFGGSLVEAVVRLGGVGARIALTVIACVDDGELGMLAGELAENLDEAGGGMPGWVAESEAEIVRAAVMREDVFDDGFTVFLEARHPGGEAHAVGVYIDNNLGVMAKDILLADSVERVERIMGEKPDGHWGMLRMERLEPGVAAGQVHAAMELTDMTLDPPVGEDYVRLRALALLRADEAPGYCALPERPAITHAERDRLRDEFSPEAEEFAPDGDEAHLASLAIDFCADYVDGRPLRWSPVVVELFMAGWISRKGAG